MSIIFSTFLFLFSFSFGMFTIRLKLNLLNWNANSLNWNKKIHLNRLEFDWHRTRWNAWNKQKSSDYPRIFKCSWKLRRNLYEKKKKNENWRKYDGFHFQNFIRNLNFRRNTIYNTLHSDWNPFHTSWKWHSWTQHMRWVCLIHCLFFTFFSFIQCMFCIYMYM